MSSNEYTKEQVNFLLRKRLEDVPYAQIAKEFKSKFKIKKSINALRKAHKRFNNSDKKISHLTQPKVLIFDIETAPMLGYVWGLWDNNVSLNMIHQDWFVLSWSAKWLHDGPEDVMYMDQRKEKNMEDDSKILKAIWKLLDEADVVITQNGVKFDRKKLNARFVLNGMQPPSSFKHIDTFRIAKKHFGFTSNKLEYMTNKLCKKYKKLSHAKFSGFELWKECLAGNKEAWNEMEQYNKYDVLSLEELFYILEPWDNSINFNLYHDETDHICKCGSTEIIKYGFSYTSAGKYQKYKCKDCGAESKGAKNLFSKEKRMSLKRPTVK